MLEEKLRKSAFKRGAKKNSQSQGFHRHKVPIEENFVSNSRLKILNQLGAKSLIRKEGEETYVFDKQQGNLESIHKNFWMKP